MNVFLVFGSRYLILSFLILFFYSTRISLFAAESKKNIGDKKSIVQLEKARPDNWAQPMEKPGLPNLHKVSDALYRGAQPTEEGMKELEKMGIKTVINLRSFHSDKDEIGDIEFNYEHIKINTWKMKDKYAVEFLKIVTDKKNQPVFVHCQHGADRTGTMCAVYRMAVQGWTKKDAMKEMTQGGFGYHTVWKNLIKFLNGLDIEKVKKKAGIDKAE